MQALERAIQACDNSQSELARRIGVRQGHVWAWLNRENGRVPREKCPDIEAATGGSVRCEDLRDDVTWHRDEAGNPTGYTVPVTTTAEAQQVST